MALEKTDPEKYISTRSIVLIYPLHPLIGRTASVIFLKTDHYGSFFPGSDRIRLMDQMLPIKKRRLRYAGTHPRKFEQKYKELQPDKYVADVQKVIGRGQTPAGMHRPVLVREVLEIIDPKPGEIGIDATLGFGGHAIQLLQRIIPGGRLYGIDVDPVELPKTESRLRAAGFDDKTFIARRMNFAGIQRLLADSWDGFDFILADLGVSSMQIDNPMRGFTFKSDGPLDLRLNPHKGNPASTLLSSLDEPALIRLFDENSDEPHTARIARDIKRIQSPISTTSQLASVIEKSLEGALNNLNKTQKSDEIKKTKQRVFQALRIAVNDEFGVLDRFLEQLPACLKPGGRAVILSFHSGEDRRVKKSLLAGYRSGLYASIAPDPIRPSAPERHDNPRCACVKMRWAKRL